jgi:hypothetical protein
MFSVTDKKSRQAELKDLGVRPRRGGKLGVQLIIEWHGTARSDEAPAAEMDRAIGL